MHDADHGPHHTGSSGALATSIAANSVLLVVQVVVALTIGSLALLADSLHNTSDVVALGVALCGQVLARRPATPRRSYGLARAEVLAALVNGAVLVGLTGWVVLTALRRLGDAPAIDHGWLGIVGGVGMLVNGSSAWLLARSGDSSLNVRAAFWHLAADTLGSLGVVIAALLDGLLHAEWADPAVSLVLSVLILVGVAKLLRDAVNVLLEVTPAGLDPHAVATALTAIEDVLSVHHLHVWAIDSRTTALTCHVRLADGIGLHEAQHVIDTCRQIASTQFGIGHATFEPECHECTSLAHR